MVAVISCGNKEQADAYGNFEAREVIVSAQGNGQIQWLTIEEGYPLKAGALVGVIDTSTLHFGKQQLVAQYAATQAQFPILKAQAAVQEQQIANLNKDLKRINNMMKDGAATQKQLDDVQGGIDMANKQISAIESQKASLQSQLNALRAQIAQTDNEISKCLITNPQEGTVLVKYAEAGEMMTVGRPIFKVGDVQQMKLKAYISETQLSGIKTGQKATVFFDMEDGAMQSIEGEVIWVSDKAEFTPKIIQTRKERVNLVYAVKILVKNDGSIKIGMPGEVKFQ